MTGSSGSWQETSACTCTSIARTLDRSIMRGSLHEHLRRGLGRLLDLGGTVALDRYVTPGLHGRPRADQRQPALQVVKPLDAHARVIVARHPRPERDVGDRVLARNVLLIGELPVEDREQA